MVIIEVVVADIRVPKEIKTPGEAVCRETTPLRCGGSWRDRGSWKDRKYGENINGRLSYCAYFENKDNYFDSFP